MNPQAIPVLNAVGPTISSANNFTREGVQQIFANIQAMKARGATEANNPEYANLLNLLRTYQSQQLPLAQNNADSTTNVPVTRPPAMSTTSAQTPPVNPTPMAAASTPLSPEQLMSLKYQILAYKLISKNLPVPPHLQQAMFHPGQVQEPATSMSGKSVEPANNTQNVPSANSNSETSTSTSAPTPSNNYNAYTNPYGYLKSLNPIPQGNMKQRVLIPSITPVGIDPLHFFKEREEIIRSRVQHRIRELEQMPSDLSDDAFKYGANNNKENEVSGSKIKAMIELMALRQLDKQKSLRRKVLGAMSKGSALATATDRTSFRRFKKQSLRDARITERLERQQRIDRERREKQKHLDYLQSICNHGRDMIQWNRSHQAKQAKVGRQVLALHAQIEKDEQRRSQQSARERLQALKENDEQKYRKLVDEAKDNRIIHLLKQTDSYLDSLAQAVVAQQNDELHHDPSVRGGIELMDEQEIETEDGKKIDYYAVAHKIREEVEQPDILEGGTLKDYQVKGLQWMVSLYNNRLNGILADEMGLGKTIQTISLITYLIERKKQNGPFLIVVPLSTLTNWTMEFEKWSPSVAKCVYKGTPSLRKDLQQDYIKHGNFQVLLTTYEYIIKDKPVLSKIRWVYMIIDEGHRMKNTNSKLSTILTNAYQSRYRLILTGTPLQNNLPELWSLLNFVLPKIFDSVKSFDEWFNAPFANTGGQDKIALNEEETLLVIRRLHKVLRPFLLRRLKIDVESELPEKIERVVKCKFSALQSRLYNQMKKYGMLFVNTGEKGKTGIKGLNNTIMQLRKICNHPFVFDDVEKDVNPKKQTNSLIYRVSGKFELLDRMLRKLYESNHRVLIFFQMTAIMNIMEDFLLFRGYQYLRLDGATKAEERSALLEKFNGENSPYFIFLLSTRAGGLGLNLQSADTVIIFDSDWNPHQDLQAQDRAHRIGQTREVRIFRLITQNSIEETILQRAQYKLDIDGKVIQAGKFDQKSTAEEREAFLRSLLEGDNDEVNDVNEEEELNDEELNDIVSRNDEELALFKRIDDRRRIEDQKEWELYLKGKTKSKEYQRLIQNDELPEIYMKEDDVLLRQHDGDALEYGRGQRTRGEVHYDDGLTEEQWVNALENEDIDVSEIIAKKQEAKRRRELKKKKKLLKAQQEEQQYSEEKPIGETADSGKKKRGRPRKDSFNTLEDHNTDAQGNKNGSISGKKKGKGKMTVTVTIEDATDMTKPPLAKKRRIGNKKTKEKPVDAVPPHIRDRLTQVFKQLYSLVESSVDEDGRSRCVLFRELVRKSEYPEYYHLIEKPIAMSVIRKKIRNNEYQDILQFRDDWRLMFDNARKFNETGSTVYNDADKMQEEFDKKFEELCPGGELPRDSDPMEY